MISCDECQRRLVALLDNEGISDNDEKSISVHLKDCPECRAFQEDIVKIRKQFVSIPVPKLSSVRQNVMQVAHADSLRIENRQRDEGPKLQPSSLRFPRLMWAAGLAALFLIVASWLVSFSLARKVNVLREELEISKRELALVHKKEQLEEAQERQQKAISALYFRMQELEERVDRSASPRSTFFQAERNGL